MEVPDGSLSASFTGSFKNLRRSFEQELWLSLSDFFKKAHASIKRHFEHTLNLFAKLCVGGNMWTREVVITSTTPPPPLS